MPDLDDEPPIPVLPPNVTALERPDGTLVYGAEAERVAAAMPFHELDQCWVTFTDGARLPMSKFLASGGDTI